jgi:hypothetical protein
MRSASIGRAMGLALALATAGPALGGVDLFQAKLAGAAEAPKTTSGGKGLLSAELDTRTNVLTYKVTYSGLTGPATMAHFHGPAKAGQNAPPIVVVVDPASPISGTASLTKAQVSDLEKGLWYFNVHTAANPGGEIRGQVKRYRDPADIHSAPGVPQDVEDTGKGIG